MALLLRLSSQTPGHPLQEAHYDILFVRSLSPSAMECVANIRICLTTTRKTSPFRLFSHLTYRPFPNVPKGKYTVCTKEGPTVDASTSQGLRRSLRKTRVIIGDSNYESEYQRRGEVSGREKCWLRLRSSYLCCRRKQRQWLALYEAFSQKSTTTLAWIFEKTHSWSFFLAFSYCHDHYSLSITILTNRTLWDSILFPPCKLNVFVLLLVNQQFCFARHWCILWSLFPVPDRPYLVPFRFCSRYSSKFDLSLPYVQSSLAWTRRLAVR